MQTEKLVASDYLNAKLKKKKKKIIVNLLKMKDVKLELLNQDNQNIQQFVHHLETHITKHSAQNISVITKLEIIY